MTSHNSRSLIINAILLGTGIFFLTTNFVIGIQKPIWLDEIATVLTISVSSISKLVSNLYSGCDTNPPLYFIVALVVTKMTSLTVIVLKLVSLVFALTGLFIFYHEFKARIRLESFLLCLLGIAVSTFFSQYLTTEIRAYSLFFALSFLLLTQYRKISTVERINVGKMLSFALIIMLFLYVHYFALFYVVMLVIFEMCYSVPEGRLNVLLAAMIALIAYAPWIGGIVNQLKAVHYTSWQPTPSILQVLDTPHYFFGYPLLIFLVICALAMVFRRKVGTSAFFHEQNKREIILLGLFALLPLFIYLLSMFIPIVFTQRYFVPSYVSMLILLALLINDFLPDRSYLIAALLVLFTAIGVHKLVAYKNNVESLKAKLEHDLKLNSEGIPIVCESPYVFYPLDFYAQREGNSHFYLVLDKESAQAAGSVRNAIFDYYWNSRLKEVYELPRVVEWNDFSKSFNEFFVIDEMNRMLFERRIGNDPRYIVQRMKDNGIFRVIKTN
jgi:hypothetical protein